MATWPDWSTNTRDKPPQPEQGESQAGHINSTQFASHFGPPSSGEEANIETIKWDYRRPGEAGISSLNSTADTPDQHRPYGIVRGVPREREDSEPSANTGFHMVLPYRTDYRSKTVAEAVSNRLRDGKSLDKGMRRDQGVFTF